MSLRNATLRLKDNKEYGRSPEKREAFRGSFFVGRMFVKTIERSEKKKLSRICIHDSLKRVAGTGFEPVTFGL